MRMYDLIARKRDGGELSDEEIAWIVREYTNDRLPDYQMAALLMAIYLSGMSDRETITLTACMAHSGDRLDLSCLGERTVDKHSTGGVGDKTTLIVAPIVAACGGTVAKLSGRGLGHTGGTVDKLESIEGFCTDLPVSSFLEQAKRIGLAVVNKAGNLAPADKKMYALRDVTATVGSLPLIASSVMSKKLAAGSRSLVLDVKVGAGAFMKTTAQAEKLANTMVTIGKACGQRVCALLTPMDAPLGMAVGNALEVQEALEVLHGGGPSDLSALCVTLAAHMLHLALERPLEECRQRAENARQDGTAFKMFCDMAAAQGGRVDWLHDPSLFPAAPFAIPVAARTDGFIASIHAEQVGLAAVMLGAGREARDDRIDPAAGIRLHARVGDRVRAGDVLATLYTGDEKRMSPAVDRFLSAVTVSDTPPALLPPVFTVIE